jgi:Ca2+-binding RTX toxin-like protein
MAAPKETFCTVVWVTTLYMEGHGNDYLVAGDGDDIIDDSIGNNEVFAGEGADTVTLGGTGNNSVNGDGGNDTITTASGIDTIYGGDGNDTISSGTGDDWVDGGAGNDTINGQDGNDVLNGIAGTDTIHGNIGNDKIYGGDGSDTLDGDENDDFVYGGNDNDTIYGGSGLDYLSGEEGDDIIYGEEGNDKIYGGDGNDTLSGGYNASDAYSSDDILDGGAGNDTLHGLLGNDTLSGGQGDDSLYGGAGNDTYNVSQGLDIIEDTGGTDVLSFGDLTPSDISFEVSAGNANDLLVIIDEGQNQILIKNQLGSDSSKRIETFTFSEGITVNLASIASWGFASSVGGTLNGDANINSLIGSHVVDTINGLGGADFIYGGQGNDIISGGDGNDQVYGGDNNDELNGNDGDDTVYGGKGNDVLSGGAGTNTLDGGTGDDELNGSTGNDTYVYGTQYGIDIISDAGGTDKIILSNALLKNVVFAVDPSDSDNAIIKTNNELGSLIVLNQTVSGNQIETIKFSDDQEISFTGFSNWKIGTSSADTLSDSGFTGTYLFGYGGNDTISAGSGNDFIFGGLGNDTLSGNNGNDELSGQDGNDTLHGGSGSDVAIFALNYSDYTITNTASYISIQAKSGNEGTDLVYNDIESLRFADGVYTYGQAAITPPVQNLVFQLDPVTVSTVADSADINTATYYSAKTIAASFETGSDITSRQVIYEQGGSDRGLNIYVENGKLYQGIWNYNAGTNWGWKEINIGITADTKYTTTLVFEATDNSNGSVKTYLNGVEIGSQTGSGRLYAHSEDVGVGAMKEQSRFHGTAQSGDGLTFTGELEKIIHYNAALSGNNLQYIHDYLAFEWIASDDTSQIGTSANNTLNGTADADRLWGLAGADALQGLEGDDVIFGGAGNDAIKGGADDDSLYGEEGDDLLESGSGEDILEGGSGNDIFKFDSSALSGVDTIRDFNSSVDKIDISSVFAYYDPWIHNVTHYVQITDSGSNSILSVDADGGGNSFVQIATILGVTGLTNELSLQNSGVLKTYNTISGTSGNDTLTGGDNFDYIFADYGNDIIYGGAGNDRLDGAWNDDTLYGGAGNDILEAGSGNDVVYSGEGNDVIYGHGGNDIFVFDTTALSGSDTLQDFSSGSDKIDIASIFPYYDPWLHNITHYVQIVDSGSNSILSVDVDGGGNSFVQIATILGVTGLTNELSLQNSDILRTYKTISGTSGNDTLTGGDNFDYIFASYGNDIIYGGAGNDRLDGAWDNDTLYGQDGNDVLEAGSGNDVIYGGAGSDVLYGHGGNDIFVFDDTFFSGIDTIQDFNSGADKIDIADVLVGYDALTEAITDFVQITTSGSNSILSVDFDGGANNFVQIATIIGVTGLTNEEALETAGTLITV